MTQCRGTTKKGERCRREASAGSEFCSIHVDQQVRQPRLRGRTEWDMEAIASAALGVGILAGILFFRFRR